MSGSPVTQTPWLLVRSQEERLNTHLYTSAITVDAVTGSRRALIRGWKTFGKWIPNNIKFGGGALRELGQDVKLLIPGASKLRIALFTDQVQRNLPHVQIAIASTSQFEGH